MIQVQNLSIHLGSFHLENIAFSVEAHSYAVLMGKTGSGKTTILETICGLRPAQRGKIWLMGRDATGEPANRRGIGYVPQDLALFPLMTVREHLGFALQIRACLKSEIKKRVDSLAELLRIQPLLERKPGDLSGGEAQRVALGRALSASPKILCLDEPLAALDDETWKEMITLLREIRAQTGVSTLHVTHSRAEAEALADTILELKSGQLHIANR